MSRAQFQWWFSTSLSFPQHREHISTYENSLIGFIFKPWTKPENISLKAVSFSFPSALLGYEEVSLGLCSRECDLLGALDEKQSCQLWKEPGSWLSQANQAMQLLYLSWQCSSCASLWPRADHLLNIYLSQRLFSYPQESRISGQHFSFGQGSQWGMRLPPSPFKKGSLVIEKEGGTQEASRLTKR